MRQPKINNANSAIKSNLQALQKHKSANFQKQLILQILQQNKNKQQFCTNNIFGKCCEFCNSVFLRFCGLTFLRFWGNRKDAAEKVAFPQTYAKQVFAYSAHPFKLQLQKEAARKTNPQILLIPKTISQNLAKTNNTANFEKFRQQLCFVFANSAKIKQKSVPQFL